MIDIHDFNALRARQARNLRRLRNGAWIFIGVLLGANLVDIVRAYL